MTNVLLGNFLSEISVKTPEKNAEKFFENIWK